MKRFPISDLGFMFCEMNVLMCRIRNLSFDLIVEKDKKELPKNLIEDEN